MRQMRLKKREIRDAEKLRQILADCDVVHIGAMDGDGMFVVPVNYGYEFCSESEREDAVATTAGLPGSLRLYIHSAGEGRKAEAFAGEPEVAFEMDCGHEIIRGDYTCSYSYAYRSIMGTGKIRKVTDPAEKEHGLRLLMNHMEPGAKIDFSPEVLERTAVFCIEVKEFTGKQREAKKH